MSTPNQPINRRDPNDPAPLPHDPPPTPAAIQLVKNIVSSPKSTLRGLAIVGVIVAAIAKDYPTAKWTGVVLAAIGAIKEALSAD